MWGVCGINVGGWGECGGGGVGGWVLILSETTCLAADTPLSVRAQRWN